MFPTRGFRTFKSLNEIQSGSDSKFHILVQHQTRPKVPVFK